MTAGIVLMNTQLGLRCLEILALEKDCIHEYNCGDGLRRYFTTYNCIKGARADVEVIQVKSICTPLLLETWSYMTELRKQSPYSEQSRFLYTLDIVQKSNKASELPPVNRDTFVRQYKMFFGTYLKSEIEQDWKGIDRVKLPIRTDRNHYSIPTIHNFRVHFATSLYAQDFPLDLIESIMSHTPQSNSFDSYYAVDDEEFKTSRRARQTKGLSGTDTEDEFDTFIETLGE
jgi:integrase